MLIDPVVIKIKGGKKKNKISVDCRKRIIIKNIDVPQSKQTLNNLKMHSHLKHLIHRYSNLHLLLNGNLANHNQAECNYAFKKKQQKTSRKFFKKVCSI